MLLDDGNTGPGEHGSCRPGDGLVEEGGNQGLEEIVEDVSYYYMDYGDQSSSLGDLCFFLRSSTLSTKYAHCTVQHLLLNQSLKHKV